MTAAGAVNVATLVAPAEEPVTLVEAKAHLRVDFPDDDALISALIVAAREMVESYTRLRLVTQDVRVSAHAFPSVLRLPVWPVQSVLSVSYDAPDGLEAALDPAGYTLVDGKPRALAPAYGATWPSTRDHWNAVRVDLRVGFGAASAVPGDLKAAVKLILGSLYRDRENTLVGAVSPPVGVGAQMLMTPHVFHF